MLQLKKRIALVAGTRPEAIKIAPLYFALQESAYLQPILLATAQHRQMLDQTLKVFGIKADADLNLMQVGQTLPDLTSRVINAVSDWLGDNPIDAMIVQGDTTTVLGSAIAAFYRSIPIGHVEAGLRTGDIHSPFPEEMNRRLTSPLVHWHFCPTNTSRDNLIKENYQADSIYVVGNTVIDALFWMREKLNQNRDQGLNLLDSLQIPSAFRQKFFNELNGRFILVTGHRRESFGDGFVNLCSAIAAIAKSFPEVGILYPVHMNPQVREPVQRILASIKNVALIEPASYEAFVYLMNRCEFILSDSGGVQEEAPSLGKPVLVMRESTERPEAIAAGTCRLVGTNPEKIFAEASLLLNDSREYTSRTKLANPYGDGTAARQIAAILERDLSL